MLVKLKPKHLIFLVLGQGTQLGSTVMLNYTIQLSKDAGGHALQVTDWMYLMENGSIMNRSQFRKFGIKVAELVATMRPMPTECACCKMRFDGETILVGGCQ